MIKVFVRDAVATKSSGESDAIQVQAGTRVTVANMAATSQGQVRFSRGSESLEMPVKVFMECTKDRE